MHLIEVNDRATWDGFVASQPYAQFTQSWAWGEFQRSRGLAVRRVGILADRTPPDLPFARGGQTGNETSPPCGGGARGGSVSSTELLAACQFIRQPGRLGVGYWFAPRGPVFGTEEVKAGLKDLIREILPVEPPAYGTGRFAQNDSRSVFLRFEPLIRERVDLSSVGLVRTHAMNPATTLLLDLTKSEDELLAAMHPKTRYNIKVAEKHGVTVREGQGEEDLLTFLRMSEQTAERDGFRSHASDYLRATLEKSGLARLRIAEFQGKALAANLEIVYGDTVTYLHGASSSENRQVMAPYLLHWAAIRLAKAEGKKFYDFWGCNPEAADDPYFKPSWEGITRFKRGWGGELINLAGTWDLPRWKWVYRLIF